MHDGSDDRRGRPWLRHAAAAGLAGLALTVAACGGGGSPAATSTSGGLPTLESMTNQALGYAKCMRSHGIPNFPDPTVQDNAHSKGVGFSMPSGIDTHSPQYLSANKLCQKQTGFGHISAAQLQQGMNDLLKYAECMRSHGIPNFPEPAETGQNIGFSGQGLDPNSARFKAANKTCQPLMPGGGP